MAENNSRMLIERLKQFQKEAKAVTKGPLATVLFLTRRVADNGLPYPPENLRTKKQGQVSGLGREPVQKILADHDIQKILAEEGGRTSRGSLGLAESYVKLLNELHDRGIIKKDGLREAEKWWIDRIREYFNRQCLRLDIDLSQSVSKIVSSILQEAKKRQQETPGSTVEGTVLQHLVGAKLTLALGMKDLTYHKASEADKERAGDFELADSVIHVTTAPSEHLLEKCKRNLKAGLRPIIVSPKDKVAGAALLAENAEIKDRVEVYAAETFISTNVNELAKFDGAKLKTTTQDLIKRYNEIITNVENDLSLLIEEK